MYAEDAEGNVQQTEVDGAISVTEESVDFVDTNDTGDTQQMETVVHGQNEGL